MRKDTIGRLVKKIVRRNGFDLVRHIGLGELLSINRVDVVVDIGANDGGYVQALREDGWEGSVVSFEPQPAAFSRLQERFAGNPNWKGRELALGEENGTFEMNIHEMDVLSSFLTKTEKETSAGKTVSVEMARMDSVFDAVLGSHSRPFVKIDTQGFERQVINGFGSRTSDVVGWQLELSVEALYEGQPRIEEILGLMRELGFSLWRILPGLRDPRTLRIYEVDGIFFRL
ncbi:methyltransferase FkbM family protein [Haloferula helveola]|uniref:Methyltransferase FkbM family protein n=2 Tax=Haloferula helveola TaxID=490095 RepID=A0ABM7RCV8_9BACT|nr:methyltransferase FkbM family protein [Haloferula helveola]